MTKQNAANSNIPNALESLSLEIVLADPADPLAFKKSLGLLKQIHISAEQQNNSPIAALSSDTAKRIQAIRKNEGDETAALEELNALISKMKRLAAPDASPARPPETGKPNK